MPRPVSTVVELKRLPNSAEGWCARLHAGDVTQADRDAFDAWLCASPDNRAAYEVCALVFGVSRGLAENPELRKRLAPPPGAQAAAARSSRERWRFAPRRFAVYAACAALILVAIGVVSWRLTAPAYASDVGEQKLVTLADGSTVELNTATAIGVDLQPGQRRVTLRQGEAFFSVTPDPSRPFIVEAGESEIRVLGTKFNVRIDRGVAVVTVIEGRVKVFNPRVAQRRDAGAAAQDLLSGEAAAVAPAVPAVRLAAVNTGRLTSWRDGRIYFDRDPLSRVIEEVNRYSETRFVIGDPEVEALTLSGVFRTGDTDSVAFALRESYGLRTRRDGREVEITSCRENSHGAYEHESRPEGRCVD